MQKQSKRCVFVSLRFFFAAPRAYTSRSRASELALAQDALLYERQEEPEGRRRSRGTADATRPRGRGALAASRTSSSARREDRARAGIRVEWRSTSRAADSEHGESAGLEFDALEGPSTASVSVSVPSSCVQ